VYGSAGFRVAWDNEISFHVAENVVQLRRFRRLSQARVAKAMGTSQSKVARIEGGDENITLQTLKRLVQTLKGRMQFAIAPEEMLVPSLPKWWDVFGSPLVSTAAWTYVGFVANDQGPIRRAVVGWKTAHQITIENVALPPGATATEGVA
jgi:DNA-binding Xre family transcriptional regulator